MIKKKIHFDNPSQPAAEISWVTVSGEVAVELGKVNGSNLEAGTPMGINLQGAGKPA